MNKDLLRSKGFENQQIYQLELGEKAGVDISFYDDPSFSWQQMQEIRKGLEAGLDVSTYAQPTIGADEMEHIRERMLANTGTEERNKAETKLAKSEKHKNNAKVGLIISGIALILLIITAGSLIGWNTIRLYFDSIDLNLTDSEVSCSLNESIDPMSYLSSFDERYELNIIPESVDTTSIGDREVIYQQSNGAKTVSKTLQIHVMDLDPPQITLSTDEIYIDGFTTCDALVVSATDNVDGDLTDQVTCSGTDLEFVEDKAEMVYTVTDSSGNTATASITVLAIPECALNAYWNGSSCVCDAGYEGDGFEGCTLIDPAPPQTPSAGDITYTPQTPTKSQAQIDCENSWGVWRDNSWCDWGTSSGGSSPSSTVTEWSEWEVVEEESWSSSSSTEYSEDVTVTWDE